MPTYFSPMAIPGVNVLTWINGQLATPQNGFLGVLPKGTKIKITLEAVNPTTEHLCYTIDSRMIRTPKSPDLKYPGVYHKNLTVTEKVTGNWENLARTTQVAGWPANMVCLDYNYKRWNIGIASQNGRYFLVIEKYTPAIEVNDLIPVGMVLSSSPLRGTATINTGNSMFQARIHWSNMPFRRDSGLRFLEQGEIVNFEEGDIKTLDGESSFRYEIMRCTLPLSEIRA